MQTNLTYDGSFDGFLCCVFYIYEYKINEVSIAPSKVTSENLFDEKITIETNERNADRVWKGITANADSSLKSLIYKAFLSEAIGVENDLFYLIQNIFIKKIKKGIDYSDDRILKISKLAKMVGREKHRMDAFIRFRQTQENVYFATVEPDFNTLPLNAVHFKSRYADQKWLIYDIKRKYGLYYDLKTVEIIQLEILDKDAIINSPERIFTTSELEFQQLWSTYFESTNIKARVNNTLHIKHVPKRYWKYLSEKVVILKN